jgi:hypothetical protein
MVKSVVERHDIKEDFWFYVRVADGPWDFDEIRPNHYTFCSHKDRFKECFPDFHYIGQKEAGNSDYTQLVKSFVDTNPETNKIGWAGSFSCGEQTPRPKLFRMSKDSDFLEVKDIQLQFWLEDAYKYHPNYMTYQQQIDRWKYLIDVEGCGYSGRLKILLSSPRITFVVDRPWQEWFFEFLRPWDHYVPVKRDLSDLHDNYLKIDNDLKLQNHIKNEVKEFAAKYLTRQAAEERIYEIIKECIVSQPIL